MTAVIIVAIVGILAFAVYSIVTGGKSKKEKEASKKELYRKLYKILSRNFITQKAVRSIYSRLANLSVYKRDELYLLTIQYFLMSWGVAAGMIAVSLFIYDDAISMLMCVAFAVLLNTTLIDKQLDNQYSKVLFAMSKALSSIREEYLKSDSVVDAINDATISDILKKPFDEIYSILTSTDADLRLQEFYAATPFRVLQTLVGICFQINNQGDSRDDKGNSNFISALTTLSTDVNSEITKITTQKKKFGMIEYLTFVPIFAMGFVESYFSGIMPGTALIYGGPIGYICKTITILSCIISYLIITKINTVVPVKEDDRVLWAVNALSKTKVKEFIDNLKPKNKKAVKLKQTLKLALSRQSIEEIYIQKVVYGLIAFVFAFFACFTVIQMGSEYVKNSVQQLSLVATEEMNNYSKDSILTLDNKYFDQRMALQPEKTLGEEIAEIVVSIKDLLGLNGEKSEEEEEDGSKYPDLPEDTIKAMVMAYMPGLSDLQVIDQVKRLQDKFSTIMNTKFHWWLIWVCALVGLLGYNIPNLTIKMRRMMVKTDAEDDFLQLQTLVSIYMTTDMDTLDILYELSQHSRIHKDMLTYCYHSYPANPELELTRLQSKTPLTEFKRFIGKLKLTISDLSMQEAFSDLIIEREQILRIREITIQATIDKKRGLCGPISMVPLGAMVIGELLIPLGYLGVKEFMSAMTTMDM